MRVTGLPIGDFRLPIEPLRMAKVQLQPRTVIMAASRISASRKLKQSAIADRKSAIEHLVTRH